MSADWKFTGPPPLTSGPAAAEALRKLVARLDAPGRSRFGLLETPPEIASLRAEIPVDPGQGALVSFGTRLTGVLDRIAPQGGSSAGVPSSDFSRMDKGFPSLPKQSKQGKWFRAENGEEAEGTAISNEGVQAAKKTIAAIVPDLAQLQAIFQRHGIDPTDQHGQPKMEAQQQTEKMPVAPTSVQLHSAPSVPVQGQPQNPNPEPQAPGSVLITTHGNEYLVERKSPQEIHAASLAEGRAAARGAAMPIETSGGLPRNHLLRFAAARQPQTENKQQKFQTKKPKQTNAPAAQTLEVSNSSSGPPSLREIGGNPLPSPGRPKDFSSRAKAPDSKSGWTSEPPLYRQDAEAEFQPATPQQKAAERPAFPGQLGQLLARWEDQPSESSENIPPQRHGPVPPAAPNSQVSPSFAPKTWTADPDEFARRVEDTLESVLIREIRRHGLDPEEL